ncbi:DUF305 domain-containing protein [Mangrovihabitans endophyticus]|uniref:DUF305 domain-containing protein n=1 Tax=Mangrovihabitans endophyticus TaxID=1751298 RepID=A0A8J3BYG5_9ACTN|nr:DUF305 domain-containing protein [Mangrovihabitans endophyticus]GGK84477.1 DUF305 domain-containing protein [Mangrovihabitans endophyticus]
MIPSPPGIENDRAEPSTSAGRHHPRSTKKGCLIAGVLTAGLSLTACGAPSPPPDASARTPASSGAPGFFGGTDLAWIEINIAMDEELRPLLGLVADRTDRQPVRAYAARVDAFTQAELTVLRRLHDDARLPDENPHKGMTMPGMVTPEQVSRAAAQRGAGFDTVLFDHVRAHLEQGVRLAESEQKSGLEPRTTSLADRARNDRRKALDELTALSGS